MWLKHLVLTPSFPPQRVSGIDKVAFELSRQLVKLGDDVRVITLDYQGTQVTRGICPNSGADVLRVPCASTSPQDVIIAQDNIADILHRIHFISPFLDVIHAHDWFLGDVAIEQRQRHPDSCLLGFIHSCKFSEYKGRLDDRRSFIHAKQRQLTDTSDVVICHSDYMIELVKSSLSVNASKTCLVRCGVDAIHPVSQRINDHFQVYYFGRLATEKNVQSLIEAVHKIQGQIPVRLVIRGEGSCKQDLTTLASQLAIKDIEFRSWTDNPRDIKRDMDESNLFVMPSTFEPFGLAALEAIAAGLPVAVPNQGGPLEIIPSEQYGYLIDPHDVDTIALAIVDAYHNSDTLYQRAVDAQGFIQHNYAWDAETARLRDMLIKQKGDRGRG